MRKQQRYLVLIGFVIAILGTVNVRAQVPVPEVTKFHKMLKKDVGVWDAEMKLWMQGPDGDPMVSKGVERNRMLGELWVVSDYEGEIFGQKFSGHAQTGYDPQKKKMVGTWIDSMTSSISQMEGTYDEKTGVITMMMKGFDAAAGQVVESKMTTKSPDEKTRVMTMYMKEPGGDKWMKSMEITYKRRAGK